MDDTNDEKTASQETDGTNDEERKNTPTVIDENLKLNLKKEQI